MGQMFAGLLGVPVCAEAAIVSKFAIVVECEDIRDEFEK